MSSDDRTDRLSEEDRLWLALDRYLGGDAGTHEIRVAREWLADPRRREVLEDLRRIRETIARPPQARSVDSAWQKLRADLAVPAGPPGGTTPAASRRALRSLRPTRQRSAWLWGGMVAAAGLAAVTFSYSGGPSSSRARKIVTTPPMERAPRVFAAVRGQRAQVRLVDGTRVFLAADSRLTVPAAFDSTERAVTLDGEAYFDVVHDTKKPFQVRARNAVVRDLGTRFVVRAYSFESAVRVVVTRGRVRLRDRLKSEASGALLDAGMLARIDSVGSTSVRIGVDTLRYMSWTSGVLLFAGTRLRDVATELGRWYDVDFRLPDSALAERRITARIDDQPLSRVLDHLAVTLDLRITRSGRTITLAPIPPQVR